MVTIGPPEKPMLLHSLEDASHVKLMEKRIRVPTVELQKACPQLALPHMGFDLIGLINP